VEMRAEFPEFDLSGAGAAGATATAGVVASGITMRIVCAWRVSRPRSHAIR